MGGCLTDEGPRHVQVVQEHAPRGATSTDRCDFHLVMKKTFVPALAREGGCKLVRVRIPDCVESEIVHFAAPLHSGLYRSRSDIRDSSIRICISMRDWCYLAVAVVC